MKAARTGNRCAYCGEPATQSHRVVPKSLRRTAAELGLNLESRIARTPNTTVRCCQECGDILSSKVHPTGDERLEEVRRRLRRNPSNAARAEWTGCPVLDAACALATEMCRLVIAEQSRRHREGVELYVEPLAHRAGTTPATAPRDEDEDEDERIAALIREHEVRRDRERLEHERLAALWEDSEIPDPAPTAQVDIEGA